MTMSSAYRRTLTLIPATLTPPESSSTRSFINRENSKGFRMQSKVFCRILMIFDDIPTLDNLKNKLLWGIVSKAFEKSTVHKQNIQQLKKNVFNKFEKLFQVLMVLLWMPMNGIWIFLDSCFKELIKSNKYLPANNNK